MGYFSKFNNKGIPFMDGADKMNISEIYGQPVHIVDYGYINGKDGKFACIKLAEFPGKFFFTNKIITEMLQQVDIDGKKDDLALTAITFVEKKSKESGRSYCAYEFED